MKCLLKQTEAYKFCVIQRPREAVELRINWLVCNTEVKSIVMHYVRLVQSRLWCSWSVKGYIEDSGQQFKFEVMMLIRFTHLHTRCSLPYVG